MRTLFLFLLISFSAAANDEQLIDKYIYLSELVQTALLRDLTLLPEVSREKVASIILSFRNGRQEGQTPKVIFQEERPVDNRGLEKAAVFYTTGEVRVHRRSFIESSLHEQAKLAGLELLGLAGVDKHRYEVVMTQIFPFPEELKELEKVQNDMCFAAAKFSIDLVATYMRALMGCWSIQKGLSTNTTLELEQRIRRSVEQCRLECSFGHNDGMISKGWCDGSLRSMESLKTHTQKDLNRLQKGVGDWCVGIPGKKKPRGVVISEIPL